MNTIATLPDLQKVCDALTSSYGWTHFTVQSLQPYQDNWVVNCKVSGWPSFSGVASEPFMALYDALLTRFPVDMGTPYSKEIFSACVDKVQAEIDARSPKHPVCSVIEEHVFVLSGSCFRCGKTADEVYLRKTS